MDKLSSFGELALGSRLKRLSDTLMRDVKKSFYSRVRNSLNNKITIIPYSDKYAQLFHDLNMDWLEKYFYVEEHDKEVLENPRSYIIDNNGYIFFAKYMDKIVGTVALMNEPGGYELSKMAVNPNYQGLKIGQRLMDHCIQFSKEKKWPVLLIYSNTKLFPAINLYRKNGFVEIPIEKNNPYARGNIKMVLNL